MSHVDEDTKIDNYNWKTYNAEYDISSTCRTGSNGMAGMAMAVPVFEGEKWRRLDSNLHMRL